MNTILKNILLLFLLAFSISEKAQSEEQTFCWTVTGTGTETWYTNQMIYQNVDLAITSYNPGNGSQLQVAYVTPNFSGQASFSWSLGSIYQEGTASALISTNSTVIWIAGVQPGRASNGSGTFQAYAGITYKVIISASGGDTAFFSANVPNYIQTNAYTASREASDSGTNDVTGSDGQENIGGFFASPQSQNGGAISSVSYSLTWNNTNVILFFSDSLMNSTTNPNADILAILPSAEFLYTTNVDNTISISGYIGPGGIVSIPKLINGLIVSSIGDSAFSNNVSLTNVVIPNSVASIGGDAFYNCAALTGVFFAGNAPGADSSVFLGDPVTAYYLANTTGWFDFSSRAGVPTVYWNPSIQSSGENFGTQNGQFSFVVTNGSTSDLPITVLASTSLSNPNWTPVADLILTNTFQFIDTNWMNCTARYYGIGFP